MNLDVEKWTYFQVKDVLIIKNGKGITTEEIEENVGDFVVVQSGEENNGVLGKIDLDYCKLKGYTYTEKPCLTVARSGSAGFVSFQKDGCVVGDSAKILLLPDEVAKDEIYLFLQTILSANRFKYDYGRKVTENKYMSDYIDLPTITEGHKKKPDFDFMEKYIKTLHYKPLTTKNRPENALPLDTHKWGEFRLGDIFKCSGTFSLVKSDLDEVCGGVPFISRTTFNNGCDGYVEVEAKFITKGNCISIGGEGIYAFYQKEDFATGTNICTLRNENINQYVALFVCAVLNHEVYRYSYGRARNLGRVKNETIKLPINAKGEPDWEFMENYIKSLPYGDRV